MDLEGMVASAKRQEEFEEGMRKARLKQQTSQAQQLKADQKWNLTVTVHGGSVYVSTDFNGKSDPYMQIYVGDGTSWRRVAVTKVQSKTLKPVWDETFTISVSGLEDQVKLKLYDKDLIGSAFIGIWEGESRPQGGYLNFCPKNNRKMINASCRVTITWSKEE